MGIGILDGPEVTNFFLGEGKRGRDQLLGGFVPFVAV